MANFTKRKLSGSVDGRGIKIAAASSPGTTIHTAVAGTGDNNFDEIWLWCVNSSTSNVVLTIEFGGTTNPDDRIMFGVASKDGLKIIIPGLILQNGSVVKAYADLANVLVVHGFVNNIATS